MAEIELYGSGDFAIGVPGYSGLTGIQNPPKKNIVKATRSKITAYGSQNFGRGREQVLAHYVGYFKIKGKGSGSKLRGGTVYGIDSYTTKGDLNGFSVKGLKVDANEFRYGDAASIEQYFLGGDDVVTGTVRGGSTTANLYAGNDVYEGFSGTNIISLGAGNDTYMSIGGFAYVEGGEGADTFKPHIGDGFMWVKDYQSGIDSFQGFLYMDSFPTTDPDGRPALGVGISSDSVLAIFTGLSDISQL